MATLAQMAAEAVEADAALALEAACELADLESDVPLDLATYKENMRRDKERERERRRRERKEKEGPALHPPPFTIPRSFELEAISATYQPKTVRKIAVQRPSRTSYVMPSFMNAIMQNTNAAAMLMGGGGSSPLGGYGYGAGAGRPQPGAAASFSRQRTTSNGPLSVVSGAEHLSPTASFAAAPPASGGGGGAQFPPPPLSLTGLTSTASFRMANTAATQAAPFKEREPDSDIVILHGLYQLPEALIPLLSHDDAHAKAVIEERMGRLCAPYGVRSQLGMFLKSMFHSAAPVVTNTNHGSGSSTTVNNNAASGSFGGGVLSAAATPLVPSSTGVSAFGDSTASLNYNPSSVVGSGPLSRNSAGAMSFRFSRGGGDPNASFAFHNQQPQQPPMYTQHIIPTVNSEGNTTGAASTPNGGGGLAVMVEVPTAYTIGKGGHWDSATHCKAHMERMEGTVSQLRAALKDLHDAFGDEPIFGPLIGFELNHAILTWGHVKGRLISRRKMAEFRDRKEFFDEKASSAAGVTAASQSATGGTGRGLFTADGSPLSLLLSASATLARYDGVLGALNYICKNLITSQQLADHTIVPLTLHYAIARAQASAMGGDAAMMGGGAGGGNMSFAAGGGFNPNASFRRVTTASGAMASSSTNALLNNNASMAGPPVAVNAQQNTVLIGSNDNALRVSNLISSLFAALEAFRWEFDVVDESVLTVEAIEAAILIALEWLKGVTAQQHQRGGGH